MAGISDEDIQKVRAASDIVALFGERTPVQRRGKDYWCCCPFHNEKTPSCKIDPATQNFYCFGCHEHGDVFTYVMKTEDVDFPDAVRRLADRAHIEIHESGSGAPRGYKERLRGVCRETRDFYHTQLMRGKSSEAAAARAYLAGRGLGGKVPDDWQLGFAPGRRQLVGHLSDLGYNIKEMIDANVVVQYEGKPANDRFFNRVMFPINDVQGDCIAFGGRVIGEGEPKYLNSRDTPLFHKSNVLYALDRAKATMTATGTAIVVEGYTDVIALHESGITNAVATLGTALTAQHIRILSRHAGKRIIYMFDGDAAGQKAIDRALTFIDDTMTPEAGPLRVDLLACTLPDNLDPAEYVAAHGADALRAHIEREAKPLIAFGIDRRLANYDLSTPEGRTAAFSDAIQVLAPIKDSLLAQQYAVRIAGRLQMRENDVLDRLSQLKKPERRDYDAPYGARTGSRARGRRDNGRTDEPVPYDEGGWVPVVADSHPMPQPEAVTKTEESRRRYERELLVLFAHHPELVLEQVEAFARISWHVSLHERIADALLEAVAANPQASAQEVAAAIGQACPEATGLLVSRDNDATDPARYANFLIEELAIGDLAAQIDEYRFSLSDPGALTHDERTLYLKTLASLQRELAQRRRAHARMRTH